jgi:hypothetical protein
MRPRTLLVVVLILFCLRMSGRAPAAGPERSASGPPKVYPVSLRYRQQLERQVRLPAPAPRPAARPGDRPAPPVERAAPLLSDPALPSLLVRLQP